MGIFSRRKKEKKAPELLDLEGNILSPGDKVQCHRYDLGECIVELEGLQYFYNPTNGGNKTSYVKMIDAITGNQKVTKVE